MKIKSALLLNAVTATGPSAALETAYCEFLTFYITAASVTSGGTLKIQAIAPNGSWFDVDSQVISANGDTVVTLTGAFKQVRANLTARTDGTYTVTADTR